MRLGEWRRWCRPGSPYGEWTWVGVPKATAAATAAIAEASSESTPSAEIVAVGIDSQGQRRKKDGRGTHPEHDYKVYSELSNTIEKKRLVNDCMKSVWMLAEVRKYWARSRKSVV